MRLSLALGVAAAAWAVAAYANPHARIFVGHGGAAERVDADGDGWVTRAEAGAAADRLFSSLDANNDGRLTLEDRGSDFDVRIEHGDVHLHRLLGEDAPDAEDLPDGCDVVEQGPNGAPRAGVRVGRRVMIVCHDRNGGRSEREMTILRGGEQVSPEEQARIEREIERVEREAERASREAERAEREAERLAEDAERMADDIERRVHREVVVINGDHGDRHAALPPLPPLSPLGAPMLMLFAHNGEADTNSDGVLSREEFRAQQLRFFDASDANGDGRVRLEVADPPEPPTPPEPPAPPEPPRRR